MAATRLVSKVRRVRARSRAGATAKKVASPARSRKTRAGGPARKGGARRDAFARLRRAGGIGVSVTVVEGAGGEWDERAECCEVVATKTGLSAGAVGRLKRTLPRVAPTLAALGHADRARIVAKLLEGPATYRALRKLTKMKAGPLYYHLGELRSAGLILPKQRDLYELTRGGRNLALVMMVAESLARDRRRRPVAGKA